MIQGEAGERKSQEVRGQKWRDGQRDREECIA